MAKAKAKSISADKLSALTRDAVRSVAEAKGKFVGRPPIMGFVLQSDLSAAAQLEVATKVTNAVAATAKQQGLNLKPKPVVAIRPGTIIAEYFPFELPINIR